MRKNPSLLAAVLLSSLLGGVASAGGPVGSGRLYGSVRASHGASVSKVLFSRGFAASLPKTQQDILGGLKQVDLRDPDSRQALAPILYELTAGQAPAVFFEGFAQLGAAEQEQLTRAAFAQAQRTLADKAAALSIAAGIQKDESALRETEKGLRELAEVYGYYLDEKAQKSVTAAHSEAFSKLEALVLARSGEIVAKTTRDWDGSPEEWGVSGERVRGPADEARRGKPPGRLPSTFNRFDHPDPLWQEADRLAQELAGSAGNAEKSSLVRRMEEHARRNSRPVAGDQSIHQRVVQGLLGSLWSSPDLDYSRQVVGALLRIARSTPFPAIRELVRTGLREDQRPGDPAFYRQAVDEALKRLEKQEVPAPWRKTGLASLLPVDQGRGPPIWIQLVEGVKRHPWAALLNGALAGAFLFSAVSSGLPWLAAAMMGLGMLMTTSRALWTRQSFANALQLVLLQSLFAAALALPMTAGTLAALAGLTVLWGSVAALSYRFDLPTWGWFLNWAALSWLGFALTGTPLGIPPFWAAGLGFLLFRWPAVKAKLWM